ncbi:MAG TPA: tyrosine-type recombinase/integrase [Myxococcota bacterium]|nr:tyrosine-type recombinase/integrase [Myxococcota bacterium]
MSAAPLHTLRLRATVGRMSNFGKVRERHTRKGSTRWFIDARPFGRIYARIDPLGIVPLESREDAERLLARIRARIDDGMSAELAVQKLMPRSTVTVSKRAEAWLAAQRERADRGQITHASAAVAANQVAKHWGFWEAKPVTDVRMAEIADWQSVLLAKKLAPSTVRGVIARFAAFLRWLHDREEIERLPRIPSTTVAEHTPRLMTRAAQNRVLEAIALPDRGIYLALVDLALRPSEARALSYSDFAQVEGVPWVTVRRAYKGPLAGDRIAGTKTGRSRDLPCSDRLWAWVETYGVRSVGAPVFLYRGRPWGRWQLNRHWQAACKRADVPAAPVRESTRHSTATEWRAEYGIESVSKALGHASGKTTELYAKFRPAKLLPLVRGDK